MIIGPQIRAARLLLGWSQFELSRQSGVSEASIQRIEKGLIEPRETTRAAIRTALINAGIEFADSVGVYLRADKRIEAKR
jgi:transcriptional regulator with XRE-family HTH domain